MSPADKNNSFPLNYESGLAEASSHSPTGQEIISEKSDSASSGRSCDPLGGAEKAEGKVSAASYKSHFYKSSDSLALPGALNHHSQSWSWW